MNNINLCPRFIEKIILTKKSYFLPNNYKFKGNRLPETDIAKRKLRREVKITVDFINNGNKTLCYKVAVIREVPMYKILHMHTKIIHGISDDIQFLMSCFEHISKMFLQ